MFLFYFKLFFILVLFYFIKNNYLVTILFSIKNYFASHVLVVSSEVFLFITFSNLLT